MADSLERYRSKRNFAATPEPPGVRAKSGQQLSFVIQKHAATRLHYDFRLELDGVLLSWAVPKGPSYDPSDKRMAVRTEDHPLSYAGFEGTIPPGHYGAGTVIVWDRGTWEPLDDPRSGLKAGKLAFRLHGEKLQGTWELVRIKKPGEERQEPWLLFKKRDGAERSRLEYDVVAASPDSVITKPLQGAREARSRPARAALPAAASKAASSAAKRPAAPRRAAQTDADGADGPPTGARRAAMPAVLTPQLATLASSPPADGDWVYEIKFDGYRVMTRVEHGQVQLMTRGGHDWTAKMPVLARELAALGLDNAWLDGEITVLNEHGVPSFNALQNAMDASRTQQIVYFLFDAPYLQGYDLRDVPLRARRDVVRRMLEARPAEHLRYSADFGADASSIVESACQLGLEGVIAKRADAPYRSERTTTWLKLKCNRRQEFVVGGYTDRKNATREVGSLLLGVHDAEGRLVAVGGVGTGWDTATSRKLYEQLAALESDGSPFDAAGAPKKPRWKRRTEGTEHWVRPELVVEVDFAEWTPDGQIRHASFVAQRTDKPAREITREKASKPPAQATARRTAKSPSAGGAAGRGQKLKITHPERVIDPSTGLTKLDLVRYYESVADRILPHLRGRPVSLVRGPSGIEGQLFFQKHGEKIGIPGIKELDAALWPGHDALLEVANVDALIGAAQMNVIEFHTWNSTTRSIDKPDRIVFDLDPGEGVTWQQVQEAAVLTRALLDQLGLKSWLKTSGGKGLHVVVPIVPRWTYDTVKDFSQAIVQHLARTIPDRFVAKSGASNRVGKIFVDYLRNGHGATTAAAFSARARPGMGVSVPVSWDQLTELKSGAQWTIATAREYLSFEQADPWADYATTRQSLSTPMKRLGFRPDASPRGR